VGVLACAAPAVQVFAQKGSLTVILAGAAVGAVGSVLAARLLSSLLFGVSPHDPGVLAAALLLLGATALLASWLPAARAARVDPMTTLRSE